MRTSRAEARRRCRLDAEELPKLPVPEYVRWNAVHQITSTESVKSEEVNDESGHMHVSRLTWRHSLYRLTLHGASSRPPRHDRSEDIGHGSTSRLRHCQSHPRDF